MDLRPKIAADIVEALFDELSWAVEERDKVRVRWIEVARSKIVSHSIPLPDPMPGRITSTDEAVINAFINKYPPLRRYLDEGMAKAREIEPKATFLLELMNDPEGCHVCYEGQHLTVEITFPGTYDAYKAKQEAFDDWWLDYPPRDDVEQRDIVWLLHPRVTYEG
jgi:hypothetical protein